MKPLRLVYLVLPVMTTFSARSASWPEIQELHQHFFQNANSSLLVFPVRLLSGEKRYMLGCMNARLSDTYEGKWGNFSGLFQCKLVDIKEGTDLFQPVENWGSTVTRARFDTTAVIGGCRDNHWYGHRREFHARGMKIVLDIINFVPGKTPSTFYTDYQFTLKLDATNDNTATLGWSGYAPEVCLSSLEDVDENGEYTDHVHISTDNAF